MSYNRTPFPVERGPGLMSGDEYEERHPAFATMLVTHPHGGNVCCFGSRARHNDFVSIEINEAVRNRGLAHDTIFGSRRHKIQFRMTHAQFVEMVSTTSRNSGVPVTLEYFNGEQVPVYDEELTTRDVQIESIDHAIEEATRRMAELTRSLTEAIEAGKIPKKTASDLVGKTQSVQSFLSSTIPFLRDRLTEDVDAQLNRARVEIEATFRSRIVELGTRALATDPGFQTALEQATTDSREELT